MKTLQQRVRHESLNMRVVCLDPTRLRLDWSLCHRPQSGIGYGEMNDIPYPPQLVLDWVGKQPFSRHNPTCRNFFVMFVSNLNYTSKIKLL